MGKQRKEGKSGSAVVYMTRNAALKKLQVNLREFRRLCILKGIYPRDPKKKVKGRNKTYYYSKDIRYLMNDGLIDEGRVFRTSKRKVRRARAKRDRFAEERLRRERGTSMLPHLKRLVLERYPSFGDALLDLDDALNMVNLFRIMPATIKINPLRTSNCSRLSSEFLFYVAQSMSLKKCFVSVKGFVYGADIMGHDVTWLVPHSFTHKISKDLDYKVMLTFLEFYETLIGFVNFKLFDSIGLHYPPKSLSILDINGDDGPSRLFTGKFFFLGREVPKEPLAFAIISLGGRVSWDGLDDPPFLEDDPRITHRVSDRGRSNKTVSESQTPSTIESLLGCSVVQPQWVFDCLNEDFLIPEGEYAPGVTLPPHLSPFVDDQSEGYVPHRRKQLDALKSGLSFDEIPSSDDEIESGPIDKTIRTEPLRQETEGDEEDDDEEEGENQEGKNEESNKGKKVEPPRQTNEESKSEKEWKRARVMMMSKKKKRLYGRMQHGIRKKQKRNLQLNAKRKAAKHFESQ